VRLIARPSGHFGLTALSRDDGHFNVTLYRRVVDPTGLERSVTRQELIDSLVHEWAHSLSWPGVPDEMALERHDAVWGVNYARCYQTIYED
jgi:hypothetical protein